MGEAILSKLKRNYERYQKMIANLSEKYVGKERQFTFHAGFDYGYLKGQSSVMEDVIDALEALRTQSVGEHDWPCQDLLGGDPMQAGANEYGRCNHPECNPANDDRTQPTSATVPTVDELRDFLEKTENEWICADEDELAGLDKYGSYDMEDEKIFTAIKLHTLLLARMGGR